MKVQVPRAPTVSAPLPEIVSQAPAPGRPAGGKTFAESVPLGGGSSEKEARTLPF